MDSSSLTQASAYLNNLLLARGLLRNNEPLDFATGDASATPRLITLVHDLILRNDRDTAHLEHLAHTLHTLRTSSHQHTADLSQSRAHSASLARQLSQAQSVERSAKAALRSADAAARGLREEVAKAKNAVAQVRAQCGNDVRKRDAQIAALKAHLVGWARGGRRAVVGAGVEVVGGGGKLGGRGEEGRGAGGDVPGLQDPEYRLGQESTEFLTQLGQGLSDENDALIGLVRGVVGTLREIAGMEGDGGAGAGQQKQVQLVRCLPSSCEELAGEVDGVLVHLKTILTNPNFVSIEEVEVREDEIARLRGGWDKMEAKWREAIALMDGWRERMLSGGDTVNLDELKMGLGIGAELVGMSAGGTGPKCVLQESAAQEGDGEIGCNVLEDEEVGEVWEETPPAEEVSAAPEDETSLFDLETKPRRALRETSANPRSPNKPRTVKFENNNVDGDHAGAEDHNCLYERYDETEEDHMSPSPQRPSDAIFAEKERGHWITSSIPEKNHLKRTSSHHSDVSADLTVQGKIEAAQLEAEAAAAEAATERPSNLESSSMQEDADVVRSPMKGVRRTRIGGRAKRRKSTLSPDELERLLGL